MKQCPFCDSTNVTLYMGGQFGKYQCKKCGYIGAFILEKGINTIKILIIGAGFAGLETAISLKKLIKNNISITISDKNHKHLFVPGITEYLTRKLNKKDITIDLTKSLKKKRIRFIKGTVTKINTKEKKVYLKEHIIPYDYLVVSVGLETNSFNIKGVNKFTHSFKTLEDAELLKKKILGIIKTRNKIHIAIIGGGLTGVQLASHLKDYIDDTFPDNKINISLLHANHRLLKEAPKKISKKIENCLLKQKINLFFNSEVTKINKNKIYTKSKQMINSDLIIWTAGTKPSKDLEKFNLGFDKNKGIYVNKYLQTITNPFVYSLGDCISFKDKNLRKCCVKRAQIARKQGKLAARNIVRDIFYRKKQSYVHKNIPTIVSVYPSPILYYKKFVIQNKMVYLLEKLIRLRHMFFYS